MKVPSRAVHFEYYSPSIVGFVKSSRSSIQFEDRLDKVQKSMLEDAERLAISSGVSLRVIDLSKLNVVFRLFSRILSSQIFPGVVLPRKVFSSTMGNQFVDFGKPDRSRYSNNLLEELPVIRKRP